MANNKAIVIHDVKARDEDMDTVLVLLEKIIPKIDKISGLDLEIDLLSNVIIPPATCDHRFVINDACNNVECMDCDIKLPVSVNAAEKMRKQEEKPV